MEKIISIIVVIILIAACKKSSTSGSAPKLTVTIGTQVWVLKNLDVSTYKNGDPIPKVTDATEWAALTTGAYCYYNNDSATYAGVYGKLYNWYAVADPRGLAPAGYHIPSDAEWTTLSTSLGIDAGGTMKETRTTHWATPNTGATNSSGFTGLPGGGRFNAGAFIRIGINGYWWSSSEYHISNFTAWSRALDYNSSNLYKANVPMHFGFSVRCLRD